MKNHNYDSGGPPPAPRQPAPTNSPLPGWLRAILSLSLVGLVAFSFSFTPFRASQDDFWHLKAGMLQVERGFPVHGPEPFSYCDPEATWHNHEWLAQRWFYRVFATASAGDLNAGLIRLIFFKSLIVSATFMIVAWGVARRGAGWAVAAVLGIVAAEISRRTIYVRPPVFSYLLMAAFLLALHEWKAGRLRGRWLWALPSATALWANLHGMVPLAVVCVGAYAAGEWIEALLRPGARATLRERVRAVAASSTVRFMTALLVVTFLATLAQPSGLALYGLAGKFTKDPLLQITIMEMLPAKFFLQRGADGGLHFVPGFATFWFALAALVGLWLANRGRLQHWADAQLALFFTYQGVMHWRLLPLFAIASAPVLGWLVARRVCPWLAGLLGGGDLGRLRAARIFAGLAVVLAVVYTAVIREHHTFLQRNAMLARGRAIENPMDYPVPVVRALLAARPPGQLYSPSNYCGWFMWWLAPEAYRTFADNRFDHFGSQFLHDELVMRMALVPENGVMVVHRPVEKSWLETLRAYDIRTIAIERSTRLHQRLRTHPAFRPAYVYVPPSATSRDAGWAIWVTTGDDGTTPAQALARRFLNDNPGAPHPEVLENWKPDENPAELPAPGE